MNIVKAEVYSDVSDVNSILDGEADIVLWESKRFSGGASFGDYCLVMTRSPEHIARIRRREFPWPLVDEARGHHSFFVQGKNADEVIESLGSLLSPP